MNICFIDPLLLPGLPSSTLSLSFFGRSCLFLAFVHLFISVIREHNRVSLASFFGVELLAIWGDGALSNFVTV